MGDGGRCSALLCSPDGYGYGTDLHGTGSKEGPGNKNSRKARGLDARVPSGSTTRLAEGEKDLNVRKREGAGTYLQEKMARATQGLYCKMNAPPGSFWKRGRFRTSPGGGIYSWNEG